MAEAHALSDVVIADAGPLIALSRVSQLQLLRRLFSIVHITGQIRREVLDGGAFPGQDDIEAALRQGWLRCHEVDLSAWSPRLAGVDDGEASAMCLAQQHPGCLLIIDDGAGRAEARVRGLVFMGVAAIVALAKTQALIPAASPVLRAMQTNGYFIGQDVVTAVLRRVGEAP
jgi:predicted nucleic acid-binding protein